MIKKDLGLVVTIREIEINIKQLEIINLKIHCHSYLKLCKEIIIEIFFFLIFICIFILILLSTCMCSSKVGIFSRSFFADS